MAKLKAIKNKLKAIKDIENIEYGNFYLSTSDKEFLEFIVTKSYFSKKQVERINSIYTKLFTDRTKKEKFMKCGGFYAHIEPKRKENFSYSTFFLQKIHQMNLLENEKNEVAQILFHLARYGNINKKMFLYTKEIFKRVSGRQQGTQKNTLKSSNKLTLPQRG